jgi:hypothetical protein
MDTQVKTGDSDQQLLRKIVERLRAVIPSAPVSRQAFDSDGENVLLRKWLQLLGDAE